MKRKSSIGKKVEVSIILATYNRAELLRRCISSLLTQTFKNFELIIADDGSIDNTELVVRSFSFDPRIVYIRNKHGGCYKNRNSALKYAKGKLIAVADDDDVYQTNHLQVLVDVFKDDPKLGCAYGGTIRYKPDGKVHDIMKPKEFSIPRLLWGSLIMHGNTMWKKEWMQKCPYPTKYDYAGDYIFFLEAAKKGCKFKSTGKITYSYYMYNDSISRRMHWKEREHLCTSYVRQFIETFTDDEKFRYGREAAEINFERWLNDNHPKVSFLVLYYKQDKLIYKCLDSIIAQKSDYPNFEIIICNDGSEHPNLSRYKDIDIRYLWHEHKEPRRATSRNDLMKASSGDILFFIDSDMSLPKETLISVMRRHWENKWLLLIHSICEYGKIRRSHNSRVWQSMGGTFSLSKSMAIKIGLQDERYNGAWGFEDTDWAYSAFKQGMPIEYARDIKVEHEPHEHNDLGSRNRKIFEEKHGISSMEQ